MDWNPHIYSRYADDRGRPFFDLLARVRPDDPRVVIDLGCGPGNLTATLADRWPSAHIEGIDSSPEMIESATPTSGVTFSTGDIATWTPPTDLDVLISNAALQWVPNHLDVLTRWAAALRPGSWLAIQVPGNFRSPSHSLMREIAQMPPWRDRLAGVLRHDDAVAEPGQYTDLLLAAGLQADVWETTYLHVLTGADPVLDWVTGTGLRPVLAALGDDADAYVAQYRDALRRAYPTGPAGTVFPFRRIFAVARKPA